MEIDEFEAMMKEEGILERYPGLLPHDADRPGEQNWESIGAGEAAR